MLRGIRQSGALCAERTWARRDSDLDSDLDESAWPHWTMPCGRALMRFLRLAQMRVCGRNDGRW